jgi:hypothetical protein
MDSHMDDDSTGLTIRRIEVEEIAQDQVFVVALSEFEDGGGQALLFHLSAEFDGQDAEPGMDTYCISNEVGATVYGGVRSCDLLGNYLTLQFDEDASSTLGVGSEYQVHLHAPPEAITQLREGLQRVLTGGQGDQPQLNL